MKREINSGERTEPQMCRCRCLQGTEARDLSATGGLSLFNILSRILTFTLSIRPGLYSTAQFWSKTVSALPCCLHFPLRLWYLDDHSWNNNRKESQQWRRECWKDPTHPAHRTYHEWDAHSRKLLSHLKTFWPWWKDARSWDDTGMLQGLQALRRPPYKAVPGGRRGRQGKKWEDNIQEWRSQNLRSFEESGRGPAEPEETSRKVIGRIHTTRAV